MDCFPEKRKDATREQEEQNIYNLQEEQNELENVTMTYIGYKRANHMTPQS